jgi:hypothetical protein
MDAYAVITLICTIILVIMLIDSRMYIKSLEDQISVMFKIYLTGKKEEKSGEKKVEFIEEKCNYCGCSLLKDMDGHVWCGSKKCVDLTK